MVSSLGQSGSNRSSNLLVFGVLAGCQFAVDEVTVHYDLERSTRRCDEPKALDLWFELFEQFLNHAHGTVFIASSGAVLECDIHGRHRTAPRTPRGVPPLLTPNRPGNPLPTYGIWRPSIPPATVTTWPLRCPESALLASTTTWAATSCGLPNFLIDIVDVTMAT